MRLRIAVPVLAGALVLGAIATPAEAFAAPKAAPAKPVITSASSPSFALGLGGKVTAGVTVSATDPSGIKAIYAEPYPLALAAQYGGVPTASDLLSDPADDLVPAVHRTATSETASVGQSATIPAKDIVNLTDSMSGAWGVAVLVVADNGATTFKVKATTYDWQRADLLTVKAPATAVKGAKVTVSGRLTRVEWSADRYNAYASQWVLLEYRKAGTSNWTDAAWVRSDKNGNLSATVKDNASGSWRYVFAGNSTSGAATSVTVITTVR
ncbi:hypothetical protein GXW82_15085 [Streptacidiphilus sp. 4-A2]|nr:hypothetical protein [Streptacidiphilus sp. 4-A2]